MRKSKIKKMKLASVLLLSTVLIPNIAYADEEIDGTFETETETVTEEVENTEETEQTINEEQVTETEENTDTTETETVTEETEQTTNDEQVTETEESTDTFENTEEVQEVTPESGTDYNNDIDTNTDTTSDNIQEESTEGGGSEEILQPAEPEQTNDLTEEETAETEAPLTETEPDLTEEDTTGEADSDVEAGQEYEEETATADSESDPADLYENDESYSDGTQEENTGETEVSELPLEQIEPIETVDPEVQPEEEPAEPSEQPVEDENNITAQPAETEEAVPADDADNAQTEQETVDEGAAAGKKKLYRYDYGDILNGISFSEESIKEDLSTLDQRVTRVMSSQIIEEKDLTEAQKLELEEEVKSEQTDAAPYDGEELPNTGEADTTNYAFAGLLSIFGAVLVFMSKKLKTDN